MEQKPPQPITAETICDAIGRKVIADKIGASLTAVSNASVAGKFPARWYPAIRELCAEAGHPCPDTAFNFIIHAKQGIACPRDLFAFKRPQDAPQ